MGAYAVGFDVGSRNSFVSTLSQHGLHMISDEFGRRKIPTCVSFTTQGRLVGTLAKMQPPSQAHNTLRNFTVLLGKRYGIMRQSDHMLMPYEFEDTASGRIGIQVQFADQLWTFIPEQLLAMQLLMLKQITEHSTGIAVDNIVLSIPTYYNTCQKQAVKDAAAIAGLKCVKLLPDTTAIALTYAYYARNEIASSQSPIYVAFVSVGYSSTQVCICAFSKHSLQILSTAYDPYLGGKHFDCTVYENFATQFIEQHGVNPGNDPVTVRRLLNASEALVKRINAGADAVTVTEDGLFNGCNFHGRMKRSKLESICWRLLERFEGVLKECREKCTQVILDNIHAVELVGGCSRMPVLRAIVSRIFKKLPCMTLDADEAVARGCAIKAAMCSPFFQYPFKIIDTPVTKQPEHKSIKPLTKRQFEKCRTDELEICRLNAPNYELENVKSILSDLIHHLHKRMKQPSSKGDLSPANMQRLVSIDTWVKRRGTTGTIQDYVEHIKLLRKMCAEVKSTQDASARKISKDVRSQREQRRKQWLTTGGSCELHLLSRPTSQAKPTPPKLIQTVESIESKSAIELRNEKPQENEQGLASVHQQKGAPAQSYTPTTPSRDVPSQVSTEQLTTEVRSGGSRVSESSPACCTITSSQGDSKSASVIITHPVPPVNSLPTPTTDRVDKPKIVQPRPLINNSTVSVSSMVAFFENYQRNVSDVRVTPTVHSSTRETQSNLDERKGSTGYITSSSAKPSIHTEKNPSSVESKEQSKQQHCAPENCVSGTRILVEEKSRYVAKPMFPISPQCCSTISFSHNGIIKSPSAQDTSDAKTISQSETETADIEQPVPDSTMKAEENHCSFRRTHVGTKPDSSLSIDRKLSDMKQPVATSMLNMVDSRSSFTRTLVHSEAGKYGSSKESLRRDALSKSETSIQMRSNRPERRDSNRTQLHRKSDSTEDYSKISRTQSLSTRRNSLQYLSLRSTSASKDKPVLSQLPHDILNSTLSLPSKIKRKDSSKRESTTSMKLSSECDDVVKKSELQPAATVSAQETVPSTASLPSLIKPDEVSKSSHKEPTKNMYRSSGFSSTYKPHGPRPLPEQISSTLSLSAEKPPQAAAQRTVMNPVNLVHIQEIVDRRKNVTSLPPPPERLGSIASANRSDTFTKATLYSLPMDEVRQFNYRPMPAPSSPLLRTHRSTASSLSGASNRKDTKQTSLTTIGTGTPSSLGRSKTMNPVISPIQQTVELQRKSQNVLVQKVSSLQSNPKDQVRRSTESNNVRVNLFDTIERYILEIDLQFREVCQKMDDFKIWLTRSTHSISGSSHLANIEQDLELFEEITHLLRRHKMDTMANLSYLKRHRPQVTPGLNAMTFDPSQANQKLVSSFIAHVQNMIQDDETLDNKLGKFISTLIKVADREDSFRRTDGPARKRVVATQLEAYLTFVKENLAQIRKQLSRMLDLSAKITADYDFTDKRMDCCVP